MPEYTKLKGVTNIGDQTISDQLESNLYSFLDWGYLGIGAFYNITLDTAAPYGNHPSKLRLCDDRRYVKGSVWEAFRSNWVWETNIDYPYQPIAISGIYINNTFYPTGTTIGPYAYTLSYPLGRVYFNNPIPIKSNVQLEYSYKQYQFATASVQWFRQLTQRLSRLDDRQFSFYGSGVWSIFGDNRIQFPCVVVESVPKRKFVPKQIGGGQYCYQDVLFHVFAETPYDRNTTIDILTYQNEKRFFLYDKNQMNASGLFPLNIDGELVNPTYNYPFLLDHFYQRDAIIWNITSQKVDNDPPAIFLGSVTMTIMIDFPEL